MPPTNERSEIKRFKPTQLEIRRGATLATLDAIAYDDGGTFGYLGSVQEEIRALSPETRKFIVKLALPDRGSNE